MDKMKIILAKTSGFCMGVKRAMQLSLSTAEKHPGEVFTCGPLIHNPQAIQYLGEHGVETINDWQNIQSGTIIIRAHGMPKQSLLLMREKGLNIVDATCPHVVTSQKQIEKYSNLGFFIFIIGDPMHPEILSLQSFASDFSIISSKEQALTAGHFPKAMIIAQTTFNADEFNEVSVILKEKGKEVVICNSICRATSDRQNEIKMLAGDADAVIIVGGKSSANTRRLAEIANSLCPLTLHVETENELRVQQFLGAEKIVISAGASTPDFITDRVIAFIKSAATEFSKGERGNTN